MSHPVAEHAGHHEEPNSTGIPNKKLFMWLFLASDCMFFGCLIANHLVYRSNPPAGTPDPRTIFDIELTSFSTFILLMSSLMMALTVAAIEKNNIRSFRRCILTTCFFGMIFLGCQAYEFVHFVQHSGFTLSSSLMGSTFYMLTSTHGIHVSIGILWLLLMYVQSFKPANAHGSVFREMGRSLGHAAFLVAVAVGGLLCVLGLVHGMEDHGVSGAAIGAFFSGSWLWILILGAGLVGSVIKARQSGPVDFGVKNAIDVESAGLYWHFVDIVWIVIFTVVYLLEYI